MGKLISERLRPPTQNDYTLKNTFDAANPIKSISDDLLAHGYEFASFYVESAFTNVPVQRTLKIIEHGIYNKKLVTTNLQKFTQRKLMRAIIQQIAILPKYGQDALIIRRP